VSHSSRYLSMLDRTNRAIFSSGISSRDHEIHEIHETGEKIRWLSLRERKKMYATAGKNERTVPSSPGSWRKERVRMINIYAGRMVSYRTSASERR
jgi:hypothetical protein